MLSIYQDPVLKDYFLDHYRFSDMINACFFQGTQCIHPDSLMDVNSESSTVFDIDDHQALSISRCRDTFFKADFIMIGIENQSYVDHLMPLRNFIYDAINANIQLRNYQNEKKKGKKGDFRLIPAVTIVLYYGQGKWTGPKTLLEMSDIPESMKTFGYNDWNAHIYDIKDIDISLLHNMDNRQMVEGVQRIYDWDSEISHLKDEIISKDVALAIAAITGNQEVLEMIRNEKGERVSMCESIDKCLRNGRLQGYVEEYAEGYAKGYVEGLAEGYLEECAEVLVKVLQKKLGYLSQYTIEMINHANRDQINQLTLSVFDIMQEKDICHLLEA